MVGNGFIIFYVSQMQLHLVSFFTHDFVNGLLLLSKYQGFFIARKSYLTVQSWLLLIEGSSNFYCAMGQVRKKN